MEVNEIDIYKSFPYDINKSLLFKVLITKNVITSDDEVWFPFDNIVLVHFLSL